MTYFVVIVLTCGTSRLTVVRGASYVVQIVRAVFHARLSNLPLYKNKGKESKSIYIALFYQASESAQTWITQFYLQITPCLPFPRKRSPDVATPTEVADI